MKNIIEQIRECGVVPVIKLKNVSDAQPLAKALIDGGLNCAEITFRTDDAAQSIREIKNKYPDMLIAAGTVLTAAQADEAMDAGASLIVSPGLNSRTVEHCQNKGYPIIPGVCTPSEIEMALALGLVNLKFFPAEASGGTAMIKALSAPYSMVHFMPTGGITASNLTSYLACNSVLACGGSWMVPSELIESGDFSKIEMLTADAVQLVKEVRKQ